MSRAAPRKFKGVFLLTKIIIIMKSEFYHIEELNLSIRLDQITSFKLDGGFKNAPENLLKCCIIVNPNSVYWCDKKHYHILNSLFIPIV